MLTEQQQLSPHDCLAVLRAAKKDFMAVMAKVFLDTSVTLEKAACSFVVYSLQAVVILKHLQQAGVVEHMTVRLPGSHWQSLCGHRRDPGDGRV